MADISKITPPGSQTTYNLKDATAREQANWNTNNGVKNLLKTSFINSEVRGVAYTLNADSSITVKGTANSTGSEIVIFNGVIAAGNYIMSIGATMGSGNYVTARYSDRTETAITGDNTSVQLNNKNISTVYIYIGANKTVDVTIYPMLTLKSLYDADSTYEPYALPNTKITPELIELVDSGAKNELHFTLSELQTWNTSGATWSGNVCTTNGIAFTVNSDGTITANGTLTAERALFRIMWNTPNVYGGKILSGCPSGGSTIDYGINIEQAASPWASIAQDYGNGSMILNNTSNNIYGYISVKKSVSNLTFKPMICTKAAWDVSQKFVPYRPTYEETVEQVSENKNNILLLERLNGKKNYFNNKAVSKTVGTLTFTVNDDKSITVSGSNSTSSAIVLYLSSLAFEYIPNNNIGKYLIGITDGSVSTYRLNIIYSNNGTSYASEAYQTTSPYKIANNPYYEIQLSIAPGYAFSEPKTFYPMIIDEATLNAGFTDYQPYAMSNAELTSAIQAIQAQLANT